MRADQLQNHFYEILAGLLADRSLEEIDQTDEVCLSDQDMFRLWNALGEELGIDLSLATPEQRKLLFEACEHGRKIAPKKFSSLLWLMYYAEPHLQ